MVLFPTPTPSNLFRMTLLKNYFLIVECIALINKLLKTNLTRNTRLCKMLWMTVLLLVITIILVKKSWDTKTDVFDIWIVMNTVKPANSNSVILNSNSFPLDFPLFFSVIYYWLFQTRLLQTPAVSNWFLFPLAKNQPCLFQTLTVRLKINHWATSDSAGTLQFDIWSHFSNTGSSCLWSVLFDQSYLTSNKYARHKSLHHYVLIIILMIISILH